MRTVEIYRADFNIPEGGFLIEPGKLRRENNRSLTLHTHQAFELFFVRTGGGKQFFMDGEYPFNPGDIYICSPYHPHIACKHGSEPADTGYLLFDHTLCSFYNPIDPYFRIFYDPFVDKQPVIPGGSPAAAAIMALIERLRRIRGDNPLLDRALLLEILALVSGYYYPGGTSDTPLLIRTELQQVLKYIQEHFNENLTIDTLSKTAGLSRSRFETLFSRTFGITPIAYLNRLRIFMAKRFMLGGFTISESLQATGFSSSSRFAKIFRQYEGLSPREWLRRNA